MEPTQFGNYTLIERISHGGMAEVYRAKSFGEAGFEREVALKLLLPSMASDTEFINMLIDEAKIAGQLNHANIAQIFDLGVTDDRYYIVQEYVSGQDLRAILQEKAESKTPLDISTSCHIALKVCEGLYYAHNKQDQYGRPLNLVHRDISPHNILISNEGEVKIIDFGIAKAEGRSTQTMAGLVKGKFAYMSPEQIRGLPVDHRSDVFATGILLHEMLSNQSLFRRASEFETLKRARSATAEPPSLFNPKVLPALDVIVLKALARHVDDRYQSALELRDALWAFARAHNTFSGGASFASSERRGNEDLASIEVELASQVSKLVEVTRDGGASKDYSYDLDEEGEGESDFDETANNATMVDPGLPFGLPGEEETDEDDNPYVPTADHDAQWARDVAGPLRSPFAMPSLEVAHRPTKQILAVGEDETTSDRGGRREASTDRYGQDASLALDESTAEKPLGFDKRPAAPTAKGGRGLRPDSGDPTVQDDAGHARQHAEQPRRALGIGPTDSAFALAPTEALAQEDLMSPPALDRERSARADQNYSAPGSMQPAPLAGRQQSPPGRFPAGYPLPTPPQPAANHVLPTDVPPGFSQPGFGQPGPPNNGYVYPPQAAYPNSGHPPSGYRAQGHMPPSYTPTGDSSGGYPLPGRAGSGSAPMAYPRADSGSAPYVMPMSSSGPMQAGAYGQGNGSKQLYLLMSAIFVLLLAGAATVTLLITG